MVCRFLVGFLFPQLQGLASMELMWVHVKCIQSVVVFMRIAEEGRGHISEAIIKFAYFGFPSSAVAFSETDQLYVQAQINMSQHLVCQDRSIMPFLSRVASSRTMY